MFVLPSLSLLQGWIAPKEGQIEGETAKLRLQRLLKVGGGASATIETAQLADRHELQLLYGGSHF